MSTSFETNAPLRRQYLPRVPLEGVAEASTLGIEPPLTRPQEVPFVDWVHQLFAGGRRPRNDEERDVVARYERAKSMRHKLLKQRGKRYQDCSFSNYKTQNEAQTAIVAQLLDYAKSSEKEITEGRNVVLFGPKGTGKDHLLMALAQNCGYWSGAGVRWVNGVDLQEEFKRDAMDRPSLLDLCSFEGESIETADVLWISDPLPPTGVLSEFQQAALFRLIDKRYSSMKPVWVSLNVASAAEAEERMGAQVVDRLRHGALCCRCDWPSFRESD